MIWVDAPESYDTRYSYTECFWTVSSKYLKNLLSNKKIWLEYDNTQWRYDKYDRILAYVFLNWENINKKIISDWYLENILTIYHINALIIYNRY